MNHTAWAVRQIVERYDDGSMLVHYVETIDAINLRADAFDANGFLRVRGRIMREGVLQYGDDRESWGELRDRETIDAALPTFAQLPITLGHPNEFLNPDNVAKFAVGSTGSIVQWDPALPSHVVTDMTAWRRDALDAINEGVMELSVGITALIRPVKGPGYEYVQTNLRGNHVAIVPQGRAGADARLLIGDQMPDLVQPPAAPPAAPAAPAPAAPPAEVDINGVKHPVPVPVAELVQSLMAQVQSLMAQAPAAPPAPAEDAPVADPPPPAEDDEQKAKVDALEAENARLRAAQTARDRSDLVAEAKKFAPKIVIADADTPNAIRLKTIALLEPALASKITDATSVTYVQAAYDTVIARVSDSKNKAVSAAVAGAAEAAAQNPHEIQDWLVEESE